MSAPSSTTVPPTASPAVGTGLMNAIGGWYGILPSLILIAGIAAITIGSLASPESSDKALITLLGGILGVVVGGIGLSYTTGKLSGLSSWFSGISGQGETTTQSLGLTGLIILITVALFLTFYYSKAESLSIIFVVSLVLLVIGVIGTLYRFSEKSTLANVVSRFGFSLYFFMPYALFTFGFVHDAIMKKLQYIPASFAGLTGILFNYLLTVLDATSRKVPMPIVTNSLCEIPGLSQLSSSFAPQSMMFTLSILAYIATYINRSHIGGTTGFAVDYDYRWPSGALWLSVAIFHVFILYGTGCIDSLIGKKVVWGVLLPLVWGGLWGLGMFSSLESADRNTAPAAPDAPAGNRNLRTASRGVDTATCSANAPDGEFTCETFKNGKLETSVITE